MHARAPGPERLQAAIDLVVARLQPDQIILFGSAAREEMSASSDLDLLVIRKQGPHEFQEAHEHWECEQTGDELDVILMDPTTAERGRRSAARIQGAALEEGRTIYARKGVTPLPTGPARTRNGRKMVKSTLCEPDYAHEFIDQAARKWDLANYAPHPVDKCEMLQASMERALKALITAQGRRVARAATGPGNQRPPAGALNRCVRASPATPVSGRRVENEWQGRRRRSSGSARSCGVAGAVYTGLGDTLGSWQRLDVAR